MSSAGRHTVFRCVKALIRLNSLGALHEVLSGERDPK